MDIAVASPAVSSLVQGMWCASGDAKDAMLPGVVAPDSHVEFVFHLGETWRMQRAGQTNWISQPRAFIYAQSHGALRFAGEGAVSVIAFRVSPVVASHLLRRPPGEMWNEPIALADLLGAEALQLCDGLARASEPQRFVLLRQWIEKRLQGWGGSDWNTQRLFGHLMWRAPGRQFAQIAKELGWSTRSLRRLFADHAGLSPKSIQLAGRHLDACALLRERPDMDVTEIADCVGFFDHAAFTHSFRERLGMSPSQFRGEAHAFYERRP